MPRGIYNRKQSAGTDVAVAEVAGIIRTESFTAIKGWDKLNKEEQTIVLNESQGLGLALLHYGEARLAVGEHLAKLQAILEPHNMFTKFLARFRFSRKTAYRYIAGFNNAKQRLPQTVLKAAMTRGVPIIGDTEQKPLGVYTDAATKLPPPQTATEDQANAYLDALENARRVARQEMAAGVIPLPVGDPQTLMKECVRFTSTRYKRLPQNKRTRDAWAKQLIGILMAEMGIGQATMFSPVPLPEDFIVHRGRPATKVATA